MAARRPILPVPLFVLLLAGFVLASAAPPAHASHFYALGVLAPEHRPYILSWDVLIVPAAAVEIINDDGALGGSDPADPDAWTTAFMDAAAEGILAWLPAIQAYGPEWLHALEIRAHVLTPGDDLQGVYAESEAVVYLGPYQYPGQTTSHHEQLDDRCLARVSTVTYDGIPQSLMQVGKLVPRSVSPSDVYSITAHEFGHCLGVEHVVGEPVDELMNAGYAYRIGGTDTPRLCASNLDVSGVAAANQHLIGMPFGPDSVSITAEEYSRMTC